MVGATGIETLKYALRPVTYQLSANCCRSVPARRINDFVGQFADSSLPHQRGPSIRGATNFTSPLSVPKLLRSRPDRIQSADLTPRIAAMAI